jgi:hypothetical protein
MIQSDTFKQEIAIGVTGHRWIKGSQEILAAIDHILEKIRQTYPDRFLTVLSALAQGADIVVAKHLLRLSGTKLTVILPMPKKDYLTDFGSDESIHEFHRLLGQAHEIIELSLLTTREESYAAVGNIILDQCDLLIAIWDGQPARGEGGTGEIVESARKRGIPLAWIQPNQQDHASGVNDTQGENVVRIQFERFSPQKSLSDNDAM